MVLRHLIHQHLYLKRTSWSFKKLCLCLGVSNEKKIERLLGFMLDEISQQLWICNSGYFVLIPKIWQFFNHILLDKFIMHKPLNFWRVAGEKRPKALLPSSPPTKYKIHLQYIQSGRTKIGCSTFTYLYLWQQTTQQQQLFLLCIVVVEHKLSNLILDVHCKQVHTQTHRYFLYLLQEHSHN